MSQSSTNYLEALQDYNNSEMTDFKDDFIETQWKEASNKGNKADQEYYESRMSDPLQLIYKASDDSAEIAAALYDEANEEKITDIVTRMDSAIILNGMAKKYINEGDEANSHGDKFTFVTVLFTIVLFFGGMAAVSQRFPLKLIYTSLSFAMFIYSTIKMFGIPFP